MASAKWTDEQFGQQLKKQRQLRGWTQPQLAAMLIDKGVSPMHATTIAKIEAAQRSVRINEAVAIADLFSVSVDSLLGRQEPDDTTFFFAMTVLQAYVDDAVGKIREVQGVYSDIDDQIDGVAERFDFACIEGLRAAAREMDSQLMAAHASATRLISQISAAIVDPEQAGEGARAESG